MTTTQTSNEATIAAVERAADVLTLFASSDSALLGVTEISKELELSKAVVHRILTSFRSKGFIELDEATRRYALGPAALALGHAYLRQIDVRAMVHPTLVALSAESGETATLSIRTGWTRMYLEQVIPKREVKMIVETGRAHALHVGASGKAFLAFLTPDQQVDYLAELDGADVDVDGLRSQLSEIRKRGYAVSFGERIQGAVSVAAPIRNHDGEPEAVVSICGPAERMGEKVMLASERLVRSVAEVSRKLGYEA